MELPHEEILDELLLNQKSLTKTERVKLFVSLPNYIFPKTKSVCDKFTLSKLKEIDSQGFTEEIQIHTNNSLLLHN